MSWEYNNYLAHHGVKGQKWGVRRYQNEDGTSKLSLLQRLTHNKKEEIRSKALEENRNKQRVHEQERDDWKKEENKVRKAKGEYVNKDYYAKDLSFAKSQAARAQRRVDAWMKREKRLMNMNIDEMSVRQVRKATKLKFHEFAMPDG